MYIYIYIYVDIDNNNNNNNTRGAPAVEVRQEEEVHGDALPEVVPDLGAERRLCTRCGRVPAFAWPLRMEASHPAGGSLEQPCKPVWHPLEYLSKTLLKPPQNCQKPRHTLISASLHPCTVFASCNVSLAPWCKMLKEQTADLVHVAAPAEGAKPVAIQLPELAVLVQGEVRQHLLVVHELTDVDAYIIL